MVSGYRTPELEDTTIPIKDVIPNPTGIVINCGQSASLGLRATREKSEALRISAAKLAIDDMTPLTTPHARSLPCAVLP